MSKKYAFIGPESTGKSTTAMRITEMIDGIYVSEMARDYLQEIVLDYNYKDILEIALLQISEESKSGQQFQNKILICDTELITIQIWLEYKGYLVPDWLITEIENANYEKYLLFDIDIPWIADPLRFNEDDRKEIFEKFIEKLEFYKKDYVIIRGKGEERVSQALRYVL